MNPSMPEGAPLLRVDALNVSLSTPRGALQVVDGVSLDIREGETFALLGESGCGKSMTAAGIMRLLPPGGKVVGGAVEIGGRDLCGLPEAAMRSVRGGELAMIFQEPGTSLNPVLTVGRQIGEVLAQHRGLHGGAAQARAAALLEAVGIPDPVRRLADFPFQLSGGMKQRVMIAMALAGEPRLLIADEPTTALDVTIQAQVLDLLRDLQRERGMGMLLITHDLGVVAGMAHRVGVMYAGHLVESAPRDTFFRQPLHPYSRKLFEALPDPRRREGRLATIPGQVPSLAALPQGCRFAPRCEHAWARCREDAPAWHQGGDGQWVRCHVFDPTGTAAPASPGAAPGSGGGAPIGASAGPADTLRVESLQVHFPVRKGVLKRVVGHVKAVDGLDLCLRPGRTVALVGESGCGKTTVGKAVLGLVRPTGGRISLGELDLVAASGEHRRAARGRVQMVFQDPFASLNPRMRVGEILEEGVRALGGARVADFDAAALLERVGLEAGAIQRYPHEFSGGQRQRLAIARALAVRPDFLLCDEPTSALDVSVQAQILNLLRSLQVEYGLGYLFITHNLAVVDYLAHEVCVMYLGRLVERGTVEEVMRDPRHPYTRALLAAVPRVDAGGPAPGPALRMADLPSPLAPPPGCHFHPRCPMAEARCREHYPQGAALSPSRIVHCHLVAE